MVERTICGGFVGFCFCSKKHKSGTEYSFIQLVFVASLLWARQCSKNWRFRD